MKQDTKLPTFIAKWHRNYKVGRTTPKIWFFEDPAFRYIKITKVASTSIEHSLSVFAHCKFHGGKAEDVDPQMVKHYSRQYSKHGLLEDLLGNNDPFIFAFVRNPLNRLLSSYTDKILKARAAGQKKCIFWNLDIHFDMSFEQFVNRVAEIPDAKIDRHLRSQTFFLCKGDELMVDFIGKFESLLEDWQKLMEKLSLPPLPHKNISLEKSENNEESFYTKKIAEIAIERYRKDIELLGYKDEIASFVNSLPLPKEDKN